MTEIPVTSAPTDPVHSGWRMRTYVGLWMLYVVLRIRLNCQAGAFIFFLFDAFAFFAGLIWLANPHKRKRALLLLACLVPGIPLAMLIVHVQSGYTIDRGNQIVLRINEFKGDNGTFPESLQDLVPRYLPGIPRTCMGWIGGHFLYVRDNSPIDGQERFRLLYAAPMGMSERGMQYRSDLNLQWHVVGN